MIPKAALTLAVVLALLVVAPAHGEAQDTDQESAPLSLRLPVMGESTFSMTSTSTAQYRGDNFNHNLYDDDFIGLGQRFDLALQGDELGVSLRLDGFVPLRVSVCPPGPMEALCYLEPDARPERFTISWAHDDWTIELGDSYVVLGRGIALSFRKVDLLGVDDALRGAHVTLDAHRLIGHP